MDGAAQRREVTVASPLPDVRGAAAVVLAASVARRYYLDGRSKIEIGEEFGLSRFKVARLLDAARASGLVRVEINYRGPVHLDLSDRLRSSFGLCHAIVIEAPEDDAVVLRQQLGAAAADLLTDITGATDVLGLAWARSLMAMRSSLTRLAPCSVVQLTGALSRPDVDESSIELVRDVARIAGGPAAFFYAPMILPDATIARALRQQPQVARAIAQFPAVTKAVIGIGSWVPPASTVVDAITRSEYRDLKRLGVRAELSGVLINAAGESVPSTLTSRTIGITADQMRSVPNVIAIPYGVEKAAAVRAAIVGGFINSVVTHTGLARELLTLR